MVRGDPAQFLEPKCRDRCENFAFVLDRGRQNTVKSRKSIRRDKQKPMFIDLVNVTHFAAVDEFQFGNKGFGNSHISWRMNS